MCLAELKRQAALLSWFHSQIARRSSVFERRQEAETNSIVDFAGFSAILAVLKTNLRRAAHIALVRDIDTAALSILREIENDCEFGRVTKTNRKSQSFSTLDATNTEHTADFVNSTIVATKH